MRREDVGGWLFDICIRQQARGPAFARAPPGAHSGWRSRVGM